MSGNDAEQALIDQAVAGDEQALERLLLERSPQLRRHVGERLPPALQGEVDVDDVLQQTFIKVFRGIGGFRSGDGSSFPAWLKSIAERRLQDAIKSAQRRKRGGQFHRVRRTLPADADSITTLIERLPGHKSTPSQSAARHESVEAVRIGIAALPEDQREAICLHLLEGRSLAETADAMERSPGAVRGLVHRAKLKLAEALGRPSQWLGPRE